MADELRIPASLDGERVDRAIALLTGWQRSQVQTLLERHEVLVDGNPVAKSHRLHSGNVVELLSEPAVEVVPQPDPNVPVTVRYVDDDVVVVAKPADLVVHPGAGHIDGTLVNGLLAQFPDIAGVGDPYRPGIVHRLDRDTSGLLVVARSPRAYDALVTELANRAVERSYVALVWGHLASRRGVIDAPIGRSAARRTRMAVRDAGKPARTEYAVREEFDRPVCTLLDCHLETGRTHQIRVHLAAIGHPVVGDGTYGGAREPLVLDRPFLHAASLAFDHPVTGKRLQFEEPLPNELRSLLDQLSAPA